MSKFLFLTFLSIALLVIFSPFAVKAQTASQDVDGEQNNPQTRPNLLRELDLSPDQIQQIRRINKERRQVTQESQQRLKAANQALDEAIYSNAGESEIQSRQKEVQAAHAEFVRNRTINEQSIKQVLTPQQFEKFRTLQAQYKQVKNPSKFPNKNQPVSNQENTLNNRQNKPLTIRQQMRQNRIERREKRQQKLNPRNP